MRSKRCTGHSARSSRPAAAPERRCGAEAALPRDQECRPALAATDRLDRRHGPVCHPVRRPFSGVGAMTRTTTSRQNRLLLGTHLRGQAPRLRRAAARPWGLNALCGQAHCRPGRSCITLDGPKLKSNRHRNLLHKTSDIPARHGKPDIFNTDQGSQFTGAAFTGVLADNGITISMDGKGAWRDNVFVERLWRSVKYEEVYLRAYDSVSEARASIGRYLDFYKRASQHPSVYVIEENRLC